MHSPDLLHSLIKNGQYHLLEKALCEGVDPNACAPEYPFSALHMSAKQGEPEPIGLLLAHGAKANGEDAQGAHPLHHLVEEIYLDNSPSRKQRRWACGVQLVHAGADPNAPFPAAWPLTLPAGWGVQPGKTVTVLQYAEIWRPEDPLVTWMTQWMQANAMADALAQTVEAKPARRVRL